MDAIIDSQFTEWTKDKSPQEARIAIFEGIRDIPYAVVSELVHPVRYSNILRINKGSCTPKHLLMCEMYRRLGLHVLYDVYPFKWDELEIDYPPWLSKLAKSVPATHHLACKVEIEGNLVLVDATVDPGLEKLGIPVNRKWDGRSDTLLPMQTHGEEELYHPSEAQLLEASFGEEALAFYDGLNAWLESARYSPSDCPTKSAL